MSDIEQQIAAYLAGLAEPKRRDMKALDERIRQIMPDSRLWFLDGRDETGKIVSNPNIGYGTRTNLYADGSTRTFYRVGISANTSGISVYIMGIADKTYLAATYGATLGKASVTGYCIKFKALKDIDLDVLSAAIRDGFAAQ